MRNRFVSLAVGLFSLLAISMRANAHAFMVRAEPRVGSKVTKAPADVRIWFNESLQAGLSSIKVFDPNGRQVDKKNSHLGRNNHAVIEISLAPDLASGVYRVVWHVTSVDTHVTNGDFYFQIIR